MYILIQNTKSTAKKYEENVLLALNTQINNGVAIKKL